MRAKKTNVLVRRGMSETVSKTCYEYEIKCLEALFGRGNVEPVTVYPEIMAPGKTFQIPGKEPLIHEMEDIDEDEAYSNMFMAYGRHPELPVAVVTHCYGEEEDGGLQAWSDKKYGVKVEAPEQPAPKGILSGAKVGVKVEAEVVRNEEIVPEDSAPANLLDPLTKRELFELLDTAGIEYDPSATKKVLIATYESKMDAVPTQE